MSKLNDGIGFMKAGLERIIASHAARREAEQHVDQPSPPPALELFAPDDPVVEPEPKPEAEAPDFTDGTWIEQRRPEWEWYDGFPVLTGRYTVSYRKRTPDDEGKTVEFLPIQLRKPTEPEKVELVEPAAHAGCVPRHRRGSAVDRRAAARRGTACRSPRFVGPVPRPETRCSL